MSVDKQLEKMLGFSDNMPKPQFQEDLLEKDVDVALFPNFVDGHLSIGVHTVPIWKFYNPYAFVICHKRNTVDACRPVAFDKGFSAKVTIGVPKERHYMATRTEMKQLYVFGTSVTVVYVIYDYFSLSYS